MNEIQDQLEQLNKQLTILRTELNTNKIELADLKEKADLMEKNLSIASKLINGLSSEKVRWNNDQLE